MIIVLIASNAASASVFPGAWTQLDCDCPELCGEGGSGSGSGSGGGGTVCKGINIPDTVTLTIAGMDETFDPPTDNDDTILTFPACITGPGTFRSPPYENTSYTLQRFTPAAGTCIDECVYCYRLGTMSLDDICSMYGIPIDPGSESSLPEYVYVGTASDAAEPIRAYIAIHVCINFDPDSPSYLKYCTRINGLYVRNTLSGDALGSYYPCSYNVSTGFWVGTACAGFGSSEWGTLHVEMPCSTLAPCFPSGPMTGTPPTLTDTQAGPVSATFTWATP